jgi:tetratricopeptide (TPR) repeat protein
LVRIQSLRDEGSSKYDAEDYRAAILCFTDAVSIHHSTPGLSHDLLALLLGNRAAGLYMVSAFSAAAQDCQEALNYASNDAVEVTMQKGGRYSLRSKLCLRMAQAYLQMGETDFAWLAFDSATQEATSAVEYLHCLPFGKKLNDEVRKLESVLQSAQAGKREASRSEEMLQLLQADTAATGEKLILVESALKVAPASTSLNELKISILAALRRWREVVSHCERLAASNTKLDGCFTKDLEAKNPFLGLPSAETLDPHHFERYQSDPLKQAKLKLKDPEVRHAVLRLSLSMAEMYVRGLRLEGRLVAAGAAINQLQMQHGNSAHTEAMSWIASEEYKLAQSKHFKRLAREQERDGNYSSAAETSERFLLIDDSNLGGSLRAKCHSSRSICFVKLRRYQDAVVECTKALEIHPMFMAVIQRRARCHRLLGNSTFAIRDLHHWIELYRKVQKDSTLVLQCPCLFDLPTDADQDQLRQILEELDRILGSSSSSWGGNCNGESFCSQENTHHLHYKTLGVPANASKDEVRKAYKRLALKYHPDKNREASAPETFRRIQGAWETLREILS